VSLGLLGRHGDCPKSEGKLLGKTNRKFSNTRGRPWQSGEYRHNSRGCGVHRSPDSPRPPRHAGTRTGSRQVPVETPRYPTSRCRQRLSSRTARSSWFPYMVAKLVTKASRTYETPQPTQTPPPAAKSPQNGLPARHPNPRF
jgi:hypothetical protein